MRKKSQRASGGLTKLGGPEAGSVPALGLGPAAEPTIFAGTHVGMFRLEEGEGSEPGEWQRLGNGPLGVLSLGVSPCFDQDHTVVAGTGNGIYISEDAGETWRLAEMPIKGSTVIALAYSPNYRADGLLFAGTLHDGIFASNNRGLKWNTGGFGLLDGTVYGLAISPNFNHDTTLFAGTETTLYFSYNGGLAWKQLDFPEDAFPVLSLAISPDFENDQTLYVGTEQQGLLRSTDRGRTWHKPALPAECINALVYSGAKLLAATSSGIYESADRGETWQRISAVPNVISLAVAGETTLAGAVDEGVWLVTHSAEAQPIPRLSARAMLGLTLSPQFDQEPVAFMSGLQEGLWRTTDGGQTWEGLSDSALGQDTAAVALAPDFATSQVVAAASNAGVALSRDAGQTWTRVAEDAASLVTFSPDGNVLAAAFDTGDIRASLDMGQSWTPIRRAPGALGKVVAFALDDYQQFYIALVGGLTNTLSIWFGKASAMEKVLSRQVADNPVVALYLPAAGNERTWYAASGNHVWRFSTRQNRRPAEATVFPGGAGESIQALTGVRDDDGQSLLVATSQHVYKLADTNAWRSVYDFGNERLVSFTLSPNFLKDKTAYGLLLGGSFVRFAIR